MNSKTVRVVSSHPSQGNYVLIEEADFVEGTHTLYDGPDNEPLDIQDAIEEGASTPPADAVTDPAAGWGVTTATPPADAASGPETGADKASKADKTLKA